LATGIPKLQDPCARETPGVVILLLTGTNTTANDCDVHYGELADRNLVYGIDPRPPPNPFWQKKLNDGCQQFQLTLFYRLLP